MKIIGMKIKIFHNPSCKKSRLGLEKLKAIYGEVEIRNYMKQPPSPSEINEIVMKLNVPIINIVRTNEEYFRTMLKGKNFTHEEWVKIICENPRLLKRPIVVGHYKAVIAIPPEIIDSIK
jgi:arsenate reductase (glutaredoxin)